MKIELINYLLEGHLVLLISGGVYYALLHNQHTFLVKRYYVLISTLAAFVIPLINVALPEAGSNLVTSGIPTVYLDSMTVTEASVNDIYTKANLISIGLIGYGSLCFAILGAFAYQLLALWKIRKLKTNAVKVKDGYTVITTAEPYPSFSFFNMIILNQQEIKNSDDKQKIIAHELVHVKQWHSLDMVLLFICRALFWANPIVWLYKNTQQETHEYLVDQEVLKTNEKESYQSLLAKMTVRQYYSTGNYFAKNQTLKRLKMMNEKRKNHNWLRTSMAIVSLISIICFTACNDDLVTMMDSAEMTVDIPESTQIELDRLRAEYPEEKFNYIEIDLPADEFSMSDLVANPKTVKYVDVDKDRNKAGLILSATEEFNQLVEFRKSADDVFDIVEEQPEPVGGMKKFYEYVGENLLYPTAAKEAGIEGKVYVQFIVDVTGEITETRILKGIGKGCDEEVFRIMNQAAAWIPGKQRGQAVKVRMVLPITFHL